MCERCETLKFAIQKGRKLAALVDDPTSRLGRAFIETLESQLAVLQARPDHSSNPK